ncbi:MAG: hypothetical protein GXP05_06870 [Alphaproteobacteria bacterium]|nr:hypothetical protein [Alphaproteobacteria bacterium]
MQSQCEKNSTGFFSHLIEATDAAIVRRMVVVGCLLFWIATLYVVLS